MQDALYQARILDHFKNPRHRGVLARASVVAKGANPSCGDNLVLYLRFDGDTVAEATFEGEGCAISQATASLLTEKLNGMTIKQAQRLNEADVYTMLGVEISIGRQHCALLALRALKDSFHKVKK